MAFTAQLGTSSSQAGSLVLGQGAGIVSGSYDLSISVDGVAAVTTSCSNFYTKTISIDAIAAIVELPGQRYAQTLTISSTAAFADVISPSIYSTLLLSATASVNTAYIYAFNNSLTLSSTASFTTSFIETNDRTLTISSTASIAESVLGSYNHSLIVSSTASTTLGVIGSYRHVVTVSSTASLALLSGVPVTSTLAISGIAATSFFVNQPWQNSLALSSTASFLTPTYIISLGNAVSIAAIASTSEVVWVGNAANLSINGIASTTLSTGLNTTIPPLNLTTTAYFFPETLYANLLSVLAISSVSASEIGRGNLPENPGAMSGLSIASQAQYRRTVLQTLSISQTVFRKQGAIKVLQTFTATQSIKRSRVQHRYIAQAITFAQQQFPIHPIHQTVTFAQAIVRKKVNSRTLQQTLSPLQTINRPGTFKRTVSQLLKFNPPRTNLLPIFNGQQVASPYPNIYAGLVTKACKLILSVPQRTIVLPCPQLNDIQAILSSLNLKRTMTGDTYTYIKRAKQNKLRYKFWLTRQKSLEFRDFILAYYAVPMTLINWKGETWIGTIQNSPIDLTSEGRWQPVGERVDIDLEFDAIKIGG